MTADSIVVKIIYLTPIPTLCKSTIVANEIFDVKWLHFYTVGSA
jgi:hypothetical protein